MFLTRAARGLLAAVVVVGTLAAMGARARPSAAAPCAAAETSIAIIVDFGDGSAASAVCVPVDSASNGAAVLAARARQLGTPPPRFDSSGFVCAIDGYPDSGCGEQHGATYAYWSYWHGEPGSWSYSNVGPGGARVHANVTEGWRFQPAGAGNPTDPPPQGNPDPSSTCAPSPPATATATTAPPAPPPSDTVTSSGAPTSLAASSSGGDDPSSGAGSSSSPAQPTSVASTAAPARASSASGQAAGRVRVSDKGGGTPVWGPIAGVGLVAIAAGGGVAVSRRRRRELE